MSDWEIVKIVGGIASGLFTGGATALASTTSAKKRLTDLEKKVGTDADGEETGIFATLSALRKFRRQVEHWEVDPPAWLLHLVRNRHSLPEIGRMTELECQADMNARLAEISDRLHALEFKCDKLVTAEEYQADSKARAEEVVRIRENLASANGTLHGILAALGYADKR